MDILLDPIWNCILKPYQLVGWCFKWSMVRCQKRQRALERSEDKLIKNLEITNLLHKINNSHAMLETLMRGRHKDYMMFHKSRVIDISTSESSDHFSNSSISTDSSDSDAPKAEDKPVTTYQLARKEYMFGNLEKAFIYSVIKGLNLPEL